MNKKIRVDKLYELINIKSELYSNAMLSKDSASKYLNKEQLSEIEVFKWRPDMYKKSTVDLYYLVDLIEYSLNETVDLKDFENDNIHFLDDSYLPKLQFAFDCFVVVKNIKDKNKMQKEFKQSTIKNKNVKF